MPSDESDGFDDWYKRVTGKMPDPYDEKYQILRGCWMDSCDQNEDQSLAAYEDGYEQGYADGAADAKE